ncbi:hypothetical protein [Lactobacillus sp. ESL0677]|uniref:hypothetical protein n=1 Tax=Lactobacillus sp. ESL0677 TaxID=2983208 RepID=UPI0023F9BA33|nr:hypothetical protein [Lactobacillus sp. ESL0677]WEV36254.1 hypothetical protein OZX76_05770 [Lactobacillus sp. ESL0677]
MNNFWSIPTFWTLLAIIISLISLLYTFWANKYSIDINELSILNDRNHVLIKYKISNNSAKYLKVLDIKLIKDKHLINTVELNPSAYDEQRRRKNAAIWAKDHGINNLNSPLNPYSFPDLDVLDPNKKEKYRIYKPIVPKALPPYSDYVLKYYISDVPDQIIIYTDKHVGLKKYKSFSTDVN